MSAQDFSGQVVLISGAARGLGKRAAERFGQAGAKLVLSDFAADGLEATHSMLQAEGVEVVSHSGDIAQESTSEALVALAKSTFGALHVAINNAGIGQAHLRLHETPSDMARSIIDVDLMGVFYAMKAQLPLLMETAANEANPTSILNVASAAGVMGSPKLAAYAAAKHGVVGLTRSAAIEYGSKGVRINALCPAFARTNMVTDILDASPKGAQEAEARLVSNNPMRRLGEVDEVVQAMLWASDAENGFFNGQTLSIDGGLRSF